MKSFLDMALLPWLSFSERVHYMSLHMGCRHAHLAKWELARRGYR